MNMSTICESKWETDTIYVTNINPRVTRGDIFSLFTSCGKISQIYLPMKGNYNKGYCIITFSCIQEAEKAFKKYNNQFLLDKSIKLFPHQRSLAVAPSSNSNDVPVVKKSDNDNQGGFLLTLSQFSEPNSPVKEQEQYNVLSYPKEVEKPLKLPFSIHNNFDMNARQGNWSRRNEHESKGDSYYSHNERMHNERYNHNMYWPHNLHNNSFYCSSYYDPYHPRNRY